MTNVWMTRHGFCMYNPLHVSHVICYHNRLPLTFQLSYPHGLAIVCLTWWVGSSVGFGPSAVIPSGPSECMYVTLSLFLRIQRPPLTTYISQMHCIQSSSSPRAHADRALTRAYAPSRGAQVPDRPSPSRHHLEFTSHAQDGPPTNHTHGHALL